MLRFFLSLFKPSSGKPSPAESAPRVRPVAEPVGTAAAPVAAPASHFAEEKVAVGVSPEACDFYRGLVEETEITDLQRFEPDDRLFISGVLKRLREKRLAIPVLPRAALEISKLLSDPSSGARDFARVLEADPALSVDVLRIANSAYYGFGATTDNVRDAVVRIGLNQLRGLIIVTHLNGKVLHGVCFKREAAWLSDLSLSLAQLAQYLAVPLGLRTDAAFTRGMLMHVEHFVIMGAASEISKEQKRHIAPTARGLREAIFRCGTAVRDLAAREWGLAALLMEQEEESGVAGRFRALRLALISDWIGENLPGISGELPPAALEKALGRIRQSRVAAAEEGNPPR